MNSGSDARPLSAMLRRGLARRPRERLLFLHVPKCGGNSLRVALREAYRAPLSGSRRHLFHVSPRRSRQAAEELGIPVDALRDALLRYHLADEGRRLFTGHFAWPEGVEQRHPDLALVTLLRDPVAHFLSCYYEARQTGRTTEALGAFLDTPHAVQIGTRFVHTFAGPGHAAALDGSAAIDAACARLARVTVLGLLEDLPAFAAAFERRFGATLRIPHANKGRLRRRVEQSELTDALRARIVARTTPNGALYAFARAELARRAAAPQRVRAS